MLRILSFPLSTLTVSVSSYLMSVSNLSGIMFRSYFKAFSISNLGLMSGPT